MSVVDNSILANQKLLINALIDETAITSLYTDDMLDTVILDGLKEMAIHGAPQNVYLIKSESVAITTSSGDLPATYLTHNPNALMECTNGGNTEIIQQVYDREQFRLGKLDGRNYFLIEGKTIKVNNETITAVLFEFIGQPTMLDESTNEDDFEARMFNILPHYVIAKLFLRDNSEDDQKKRAMYHFIQFYKLIGSPNFQELAELQSA